MVSEAQLQTPGVYTEDIFVESRAALPTGIPGFVGFARPRNAGANGTPDAMALHRKEEFTVLFEAVDGSYLQPVVEGFFNNGGKRCYVVAVSGGDPSNSLREGLQALVDLPDVDLIAIPDAAVLPDAAALQCDLLRWSGSRGDVFALLDPPPELSPDQVRTHREQITQSLTEPVNGALYYPWVKMSDGRFAPPSGCAAGVIARTDAATGVFKAPANAEVFGVTDLERALDNRTQETLNSDGVNCLRVFPGRGIRLWGARTLSRSPEWRYVGVRRLVLTVLRWIERNMAWASFEVNAAELWARITRELTTYLTQLWQRGALKGTEPAQALYVKCDAELNPPALRETGQVVTEIGLAPVLPAEFIVVRILHRDGTTEIAPPE